MTELAPGSSIYWITGISGSFQTAADWNTGTVPGGFDQVFITAPGDYTVTSASDTIAGLSTAPGATLDVSGAAAFFWIDMQGSGSGPVTSDNQGTLEATNGEIAITLDPISGPVSFTNAGTIETAGSNGFISIANFNGSTPFVNNGQLIVDGGTIAISDSVEGTGRTTIENGGILLIGSGQFDEVIHFDPGANGTIDLAFPPPGGPSGANPDSNPSITGIISGFGGGDSVDLGAALFGTGTTLSYTPNSVDNGGTLTATNGNNNVTLTLAGSYQPGGFHIANGKITYTPPPSVSEYWAAADVVYSDDREGAGKDLAPQQSSGLTLLLDSSQVNASWLADGFFAQAFLDTSGNVIISFEGSILNLGDKTAYARGSRGADEYILTGKMPNAFLDATTYVQDVDQYLNQNNLGSNPVYLTGHSLGGAEAEYAASLDHDSGATFGAPGDLLPNYQSPVGGQIFTNYVDPGDPVGNFGFHFGTVQDIGPAVDGQVSKLLIGILGPVFGTLAAADFFHTPARYAADVQELDHPTNAGAAVFDNVPKGGGISQLIQEIASFGGNNAVSFSSPSIEPNEIAIHGPLAIAAPHHG